MQTPYCTASSAGAREAVEIVCVCLVSRVSLEFLRMRCVALLEGFLRTHLVCLAACLCLPMAALGQIDYDRHVIFDNSLADGSWYYSQSNVVGPSEFDRAGSKLPVDGNHYLTPPNALRLKWSSATGGDWNVTLDVRARYGRVEFAGSALRMWCYAEDAISAEQSPRIMLRTQSSRHSRHSLI